MERYCDLHVHSTFSDGSFTPGEILSLAEKAGLSAVALCDHNTLAGLPDLAEAAKHSPVKAVPGIEFSADYMGREVHILGLFIPERYYPKVKEFLKDILLKKERSNQELIRVLNRNGISISYEDVQSSTPRGHVNRAVIAAEMVRKGYCKTVEEAFSQWLSTKRGLYTPPERPDALCVIRFVKSIGAVSILAHPFLNLNEPELRHFLAEGKKNGLDGMEVYYPLFDREETSRLENLAKEYGLCRSGGSDFHGDNKPDISIGTGKGNLKVPDFLLERLAACRNSEGH